MLDGTVSGGAVGSVEGGLQRAAIAVGGEGGAGDRVDGRALGCERLALQDRWGKALIARSRSPADGEASVLIATIRPERNVT